MTRLDLIGLNKYYPEPGEKSALSGGWKNALLLAAYGFGSQVGKDFKECATMTADNRALELAFLDGFLSTRDKSGDKWIPKEAL